MPFGALSILEELSASSANHVGHLSARLGWGRAGASRQDRCSAFRGCIDYINVYSRLSLPVRS